ncbi:hypothetical protein JNO63_07715 [Anaerococcus sp. mt242]|uniref:hypothetical protein n=1 Tax=Anaerococcus sp. mt242 TaxID=2661917 RepID=UPI0019336471|nr:hypothetical protein [Anaerococcus sp. mt242]MBM0046979.1 hypothetical protein [Anaerococcus sp. mt242]
MNLTKLHIKENLSKSSFIIFAIIGLLITFLARGMEVTAPGVNTSGDFGKYGVQWSIISLISALASVTLTTGSFKKYLKTDLPDILKVHGLSLNRQINQIFKADVIISMVMGLLLLIGLLVNIIIERPKLSLIGFLLAILIYLLTIFVVNLIMGILNLIFNSAAASLFGIFFVIVGALKGILTFVLEMQGGLFADILVKVLYIFPPINEFGKIARDLFLGDFNNFALVGQCLFYVWILIGLYYLVKRWRVGDEK